MKPTSLSRKIADFLPGGPADGKPDSDFSPKSLEQGIEDETEEHGGPPAAVKEIVKDHLVNNPDEYSKTAANPALEGLRLAKAESDRGNYSAKHRIIRDLMDETPDDFEIDSDSMGTYGLTHIPTGFRIHVPKKIVPQGIGIIERRKVASVLSRPMVEHRHMDHEDHVKQASLDALLKPLGLNDRLHPGGEGTRYIEAESPGHDYSADIVKARAKVLDSLDKNQGLNAMAVMGHAAGGQLGHNYYPTSRRNNTPEGLATWAKGVQPLGEILQHMKGEMNDPDVVYLQGCNNQKADIPLLVRDALGKDPPLVVSTAPGKGGETEGDPHVAALQWALSQKRPWLFPKSKSFDMVNEPMRTGSAHLSPRIPTSVSMPAAGALAGVGIGELAAKLMHRKGKEKEKHPWARRTLSAVAGAGAGSLLNYALEAARRRSAIDGSGIMGYRGTTPTVTTRIGPVVTPKLGAVSVGRYITEADLRNNRERKQLDLLGSGLTFGEWMDKAQGVKKKDAALGIPDRSDFGDVSRLSPGQLADFIVQEHRAKRMGPHRDIRIGTPDTDLFSWATKKDFPPEAGKPVALYRQPIHSHEYGDFEGDIGPGYGEGSVTQALKRKALITKNNPSGFSITMAEGAPDRYRFKAPAQEVDPWMAFKAGDTPPPRYAKEHMKSMPIDQILSSLPEDGTFSMQPKIDGALQVLRWRNNKPEVMSHRISQRTGKPIERTEYMFGQRPEVPAPEGSKDMEFLGEFTAEKGGKPMTPQATGGYLNSSLAKAIEARNGDINTKLRLFDVKGADLPYSERRKLLETASSSLPGVEVVPEVTTRDQAKELVRSILAGTHPLTKEGVIYRGPDGVPIKGKIPEETDVHVRGTYPGKGKYTGSPGGFTYSMEPEGPIVGRVGGGMSDEVRRSLDSYIGRTARVRHLGGYPSGAHRAPQLAAFHEG